MASRGTTPGGKGGRSSPKKGTHKNVESMDLQESFTKGVNITEQDVEIDHLKTTIIALN